MLTDAEKYWTYLDLRTNSFPTPVMQSFWRVILTKSIQISKLQEMVDENAES